MTALHTVLLDTSEISRDWRCC